MQTTTGYVFERASLADVDQLVALEQDIFLTDFRSRRNLRYLVQRANVVLARTEQTGKIVGYAILLRRKNSSKMRIYSLGVTASARNAGIGSNLIGALTTVAMRAKGTMLTLEVGDSNRAAISFYQKCGFQQYGFRWCYYEDGGHALLMHKRITECSEGKDLTAHQP
jgi:[ribosomal protein S18]-alanine N-acetyltransferase